MSGASVPVSRTYLKQQDHDLAALLGRSVETIRSYRHGKRTPPPEVIRAMAEYRYQRAQQMIADGCAELQRLESEARIAGLVPAALGARLLAALGLGVRQGTSNSEENRGLDRGRDDAEAP